MHNRILVGHSTWGFSLHTRARHKTNYLQYLLTEVDERACSTTIDTIHIIAMLSYSK